MGFWSQTWLPEEAGETQIPVTVPDIVQTPISPPGL